MKRKINKRDWAERVIASRRVLLKGLEPTPVAKASEEGGCGVVGFASSVPVRGRHIFEPSIQMHNRGNGKGGGIAAACLDPGQLGVDAAALRDDYILQVALLAPGPRTRLSAPASIPISRLNSSPGSSQPRTGGSSACRSSRRTSFGTSSGSGIPNWASSAASIISPVGPARG